MPNLPIATFYHVGYDNEYPYNVCGGMQDNYDWCGPSAVRTVGGIANDRWHTVQGGDGFVAILDQKDPRIVYTESQDGNMTRRNRVTEGLLYMQVTRGTARRDHPIPDPPLKPSLVMTARAVAPSGRVTLTRFPEAS